MSCLSELGKVSTFPCFSACISLQHQNCQKASTACEGGRSYIFPLATGANGIDFRHACMCMCVGGGGGAQCARSAFLPSVRHVLSDDVVILVILHVPYFRDGRQPQAYWFHGEDEAA